MQEQKQQPIQMQVINQLKQHPHPHCQHKYLNRKFNQLNVELQFDQQLPIKLENCILTVQQLVKQQELQPKIITNTQKGHSFQHYHSHSPIEKKQPQSFILINYHPQKISSQSTSSLTQNKRLQLLIPLSNIMCVARKSTKTTLLMVKDQQKPIQVDENGYQLVSDQQQEIEEFEQKRNQLYEKIKKSIIDMGLQSYYQNQYLEKEQQQVLKVLQKDQQSDHHSQPIVITIEKKCTIMLTPNQQDQSQLLTKNINTNINGHNKILGQKPIEKLSLYEFLSHKLEQHEKLTTKNQQHLSKNLVSHQWMGATHQWEGSIKQQQQQLCYNNNSGMDYQQQQYQQQQMDIDDEDDDDNNDGQQHQQKDQNHQQ